MLSRVGPHDGSENQVSGAKTNLRAFAVVGVAEERIGSPATWVVVKKVVYTREAAEESVTKLNGKQDGRTYFWQPTSLQPLG